MHAVDVVFYALIALGAFVTIGLVAFAAFKLWRSDDA